MPATVFTVMSGTCDSFAASGDSFGIAAVEISGAGGPRRDVVCVCDPESAFLRIVATWVSFSAMR